MKNIDIPPPWSIADNQKKEELKPDQNGMDFKSTSSNQLSQLEELSHDITSHIFSYLHLSNLHSLFLTSNALDRATCANQLWRERYIERWNIMPDLPWPDNAQARKANFWKYCFRNAICNTHDLWITHWNCVLPHDGESDGRTCIPDSIDPNDNQILKTFLSHSNEIDSIEIAKFCPTCRYHPLLSSNLQHMYGETMMNEIQFQQSPQNYSDPIEYARKQTWNADSYNVECIRQSTMYSLSKFCRRMYAFQNEINHRDDEKMNYMSLFPNKNIEKSQTTKNHFKDQRDNIKKAFIKASTYHRKISIDQFQSSGINFLKDALFFTTIEETTCFPNDKDEHTFAYSNASNMYQDAFSDHKLPPHLQIAQHSWHICRLQNPDFTRPITYKVWIQRPDCFAVFPAEGFIQPGETKYIYFCVKPKGSLLVMCLDEVDLKREECHNLYEKISKEEGDLPYAPFMIRYMFAPILPMGATGLFGSKSNKRNKKQLLQQLWESNSIQVRNAQSMYISAHVHSKYSLRQFQEKTLMPFENKLSVKCESKRLRNLFTTKTPLVLVAPNLQQRNPAYFRAKHYNSEYNLHEADQNLKYSKIKLCRGCPHCKAKWSLKQEELGRRYVLRKLICMENEYQRKMKILQIWETLIVLQHYFDIFEEDQEICFNFDSLRQENNSYLASKSANNLPQMKQGYINNIIQQMNRLYKVLFHMHKMIHELLANPILEGSELNILKFYQDFINQMSMCVQEEMQKSNSLIRLKKLISTSNDEKEKRKQISQCDNSSKRLEKPWRMPGIYENIRVSDKICNSPGSSTEKKRFHPVFCSQVKKEPTEFIGIKQSMNISRKYSFGQQIDPNHILHHSQFYSDIFNDDLKQAISTSLAVFHDPKSIALHGVYDRAHSSDLVRSPFLPHFLFLPVIHDMKKNVPHSTLKEKLQHDKTVRLSNSRLNRPWNDPDPDGLFVMNKASCFKNSDEHHVSSMDRYLMEILPPGLPSKAKNASVSSESRQHDPQNANLNLQQIPPRNNIRSRVYSISTLACSYIGWNEKCNNGAPMVNRRILIALQWWSNSFLFFPLIFTLTARWMEWITTTPLDYDLDGLPFEGNKKMRYLTCEECGCSAITLFGMWLMLNRHCERFIGRSPERATHDIQINGEEEPRLQFIKTCGRIWDCNIPLFLQQIIYLPKWNKTYNMRQKIVALKVRDSKEKRSSFDAKCGLKNGIQELLPKKKSADRESLEIKKKIVLGLLATIGSFCVSSPHFLLNLITIFYCGIAFGMNLSVQTMEIGCESNIFEQSLNVKKAEKRTLFTAGVLIGHLVGCSGGILFLAEFMVTALSIILGGAAATISTYAIECWIYFICFFTVAFWGYLLARLGSIDGMVKKRMSKPSLYLLLLLMLSIFMLAYCLLFKQWDPPVKKMVIRIGPSSFLGKKRKSKERSLEDDLQ